MRTILVALLIIGTSANAFAQSAKKPVTPPSSSGSGAGTGPALGVGGMNAVDRHTITGRDTSTSNHASADKASPTINTVVKKNLPDAMKGKKAGNP